jgi:hypothetical protein
MPVRDARNDSDRLGIINERNGVSSKEIRRRRKLHLPCNKMKEDDCLLSASPGGRALTLAEVALYICDFLKGFVGFGVLLV